MSGNGDGNYDDTDDDDDEESNEMAYDTFDCIFLVH